MRLPLLFAALVWMPAPVLAGPASDAVQRFYDSPGVEFAPANRQYFVDPAKSVLDANEKAELCIDFILSIDAQDLDEAELKRTLKLTERANGDKATVTASFSLFPDDPSAKRVISWTLQETGGGWKVADIRSETIGWKLSEFDCTGR